MQSDVVRRFNRSYTQRVGALEDSFLGLGRPLGEVRVVFEIGDAGAGVHELRARLGLDSGYLSRLLGALTRDGLVELGPDLDDGRRRRASLSTAGLALLARIEERSQERAEALLAPLTERQRDRLCVALATADLLVRAATVELVEVDPRGVDASGAMARYVAELAARFPAGFDPGDPPPLELVLVARSDGVVVACGGLQRIGTPAEETDEVKRMWVDPAWRGSGLGARLLRELESRAVARGRRRVRLDTQGTLVEAIALYERAGYRRTERYNDNPYAELFFEKDLAGVSSTTRAGV